MIFYNNVSQPILTRGTLDKVYQNLAAHLDAKIGLKENKCDKCRHPRHYHMAPLCAAAPRLRTTVLQLHEKKKEMHHFF